VEVQKKNEKKARGWGKSSKKRAIYQGGKVTDKEKACWN